MIVAAASGSTPLTPSFSTPPPGRRHHRGCLHPEERRGHRQTTAEAEGHRRRLREREHERRAARQEENHPQPRTPQTEEAGHRHARRGFQEEVLQHLGAGGGERQRHR